MRELHWHPSADEWQYHIAGQARMTVFASGGAAQTFDYQAVDVGYVPRSTPHYLENTGKTTFRFLEMFRSPKFEDVPLAQWLAFTPHELVRAHLKIDESVLAKIPQHKMPVVGFQGSYYTQNSEAQFAAYSGTRAKAAGCRKPAHNAQTGQGARRSPQCGVFGTWCRLDNCS